MHLLNGGTSYDGGPAKERSLRESTIKGREKMNDSDSSGMQGGLRLNGLAHHEMISSVYEWVYKNGDPGQGDNPQDNYIEHMRDRLKNEGVSMSLDGLRWVHVEIYEGRWRPGRYIN